jgi:sugar phosphate isomerase/epimerase
MDRPKTALGTWAFAFGPFAANPWPFADVIRYAADAGFDGVEINGFRPHPHPDDYDTPDKCAELVKQIEGLGLGISGYAADFSEVPPALVDTQQYVDAVQKCLAFCNNCGISTLRVDTASPPDELAPDEYDERFARLTRTWRAAAEEAAKSGVTIVWEFEPGFWLNKPSEVKATVEAVGHGGFKLLFDTSHAYMGAVIGARQTGEKQLLDGGVIEYGRMLSDHIGHLHLIDSDGTLHNDETSTHTAFGEGYINFDEVLAALKPVFGGMPWWCVDFCFNPETETKGKHAVPFLKDLMDRIL